MKMSDYAGVPLEVSTPKLSIGGWLRYICIVLTLLGPLKMVQWIGASPSPATTGIYAALIITSIIAGATTWAISSSAFIWLRIHLAVRLLYAFFQAYIAFRLLELPASGSQTAQEEFIYAAANMLIVLLLFLYFRLSSRVRETFGRNI